MHSHSLDQWTHEHLFLGERHDRNARRTWFVVALTAIMMVGEITAGSYFGSMALLADGWHMGTHFAALGIAGAAYLFARQHARDARFSFGTGKFGDLAAFSSAIILGIVAVQIAYESVLRLLSPVPIAYGEAIAVASRTACRSPTNSARRWSRASASETELTPTVVGIFSRSRQETRARCDSIHLSARYKADSPNAFSELVPPI